MLMWVLSWVLSLQLAHPSPRPTSHIDTSRQGAQVFIRMCQGLAASAAQERLPAEEHTLTVLTALLLKRGRCSLAEVGDELRREGVLPDGRLSTFVRSCSELTLTGRPSNLQVALAGQSTEQALVSTVSDVLLEAGPLSTAELKLRLSERGRAIPGLLTLLRRHPATFTVKEGVVSVGPVPGVVRGAAQPLLRLRTLQLSDHMGADSLPPAAAVNEVFLVDMDNKAFMLERCAAHAARQGLHKCKTLVLGFCSTTHNPRLSAAAAKQCQLLSAAGWLRKGRKHPPILVPSTCVLKSHFHHV